MSSQTISDQMRPHLKLVHLVAYRFESRYKLPPGVDHDDLVQEGSLGLWEALKRFDPLKGSFATFAIKCIESKIGKLFRKSRAQKRYGSPVCYLSDRTVDDCTLEEVIPSKESVETAVVLKTLLETLPAREHRMLMMYLNGYGQPELARHFGLTQSYVSKLLRRSIRALRRGYSDRLLENGKKLRKGGAV